MLVVQGPHGYVSAGWYVGAPYVSTWNYVVAHLHGRPELLDAGADLRHPLRDRGPLRGRPCGAVPAGSGGGVRAADRAGRHRLPADSRAGGREGEAEPGQARRGRRRRVAWTRGPGPTCTPTRCSRTPCARAGSRSAATVVLRGRSTSAVSGRGGRPRRAGRRRRAGRPRRRRRCGGDRRRRDRAARSRRRARPRRRSGRTAPAGSTSPGRGVPRRSHLRLRAHAAAHPDDTARVLIGHGFVDGLGSGPPHRSILDAALGPTAAVVISSDLHTRWLSGAALDLLGHRVTRPACCARRPRWT